jgi:hypothetical protein
MIFKGTLFPKTCFAKASAVTLGSLLAGIIWALPVPFVPIKLPFGLIR